MTWSGLRGSVYGPGAGSSEHGNEHADDPCGSPSSALFTALTDGEAITRIPMDQLPVPLSPS